MSEAQIERSGEAELRLAEAEVLPHCELGEGNVGALGHC